MSRGRLLRPDVLFSNNHLLVVNKTPGWSSIPTKSTPDKSLLDHLISRKLGGGSQSDFLVPLHRIDQPCSGVMMFGKTSKAASRVTKVWKQQLVEKTYLCVLEDPLREEGSADEWQPMEGWMPRGKNKGSVRMMRRKPDNDTNFRHVSLQWRTILEKNNLVEVKTHAGARHMVRALMAAHSQSLAGDLRYRAVEPLPDQSVALHAHTIALPESLQLGTLEQTTFKSPIPRTWQTYFGIRSDEIV
jgi:23S rRNA pseudouridine1911/1915/1917 synthase